MPKVENVGRARTFRWGRASLATLLCLLYLFPVVWMLATAFKPREEIISVPPKVSVRLSATASAGRRGTTGKGISPATSAPRRGTTGNAITSALGCRSSCDFFAFFDAITKPWIRLPCPLAGE